MLGRGVCARIAKANPGRDRSDIDNPARVARQHALQGSLRADKGAGEVHVEHVLPGFEAQAIEHFAVTLPGIVHEDAELPPALVHAGK